MPIGSHMVRALEYRFEKPETLPDKVDGIIVLGGVVDFGRTQRLGRLYLALNRDRVDVLEELSRHYPKAKIVFTSGSGFLRDQSIKEADLVADYIRDLIVNPENLILERESRNTFENVVFSKELVQPKADETWLLVTSASHIPRAMGIFRKHSWDVIPYPVYYQTWPDEEYGISTNLRGGLGRFKDGLHEWLGLLAYYMTGKTSEFYPSPQ